VVVSVVLPCYRWHDRSWTSCLMLRFLSLFCIYFLHASLNSAGFCFPGTPSIPSIQRCVKLLHWWLRSEDRYCWKRVMLNWSCLALFSFNSDHVSFSSSSLSLSGLGVSLVLLLFSLMRVATSEELSIARKREKTLFLAIL